MPSLADRQKSGLFPSDSGDLAALGEIADEINADGMSETSSGGELEEMIVMNKQIARTLSASGKTTRSIISVRGSVASNGKVAFAF